MTLRTVWIATLCICLAAAGLKLAGEKAGIAPQLLLVFEPALAVVMAMTPDAQDPKSPHPDIGRVQFGKGDVCCPGIPARNTVNIATGEVMPTN